MRILYVMHSDWNTVKQRSHHLIENIHFKKYFIKVAYKYDFTRHSIVKNSDNIKSFPCFFLPFKFSNIKIIYFLDKFFWNNFFKYYLYFRKFDYIILTHPLLYKYFENFNEKIIYDCHDDNAEFFKNGFLKKKIILENKKIIKNSKLNIFSSDYLKNKFSKRKKDIVITNGHSFKNIKKLINNNKFKKKKTINIFYFGGISKWFDFDLLFRFVKLNKNIFFTLIGGIDIYKKKHPQIKYIKPMNHKSLIKYAKNADCFIMPFKLNNLTIGVDPVKLYEYIAYSVPIISVYYRGLDKFKDFVFFYKYKNNDINKINNFIMSKKKISNNEIKNRLSFLKKNSWYEKANELIKVLKKI